MRRYLLARITVTPVIREITPLTTNIAITSESGLSFSRTGDRRTTTTTVIFTYLLYYIFVNMIVLNVFANMKFISKT